MGSEMQCTSLANACRIIHTSACESTGVQISCRCPPKVLSGTRGYRAHRPGSRGRVVLPSREQKASVTPWGNHKCLQSMMFNPVLVFGRQLTVEQFLLVQFAECDGFNSAVWRGAVPEFTTKETSSLSVQVCLPLLGTHKCLEMRYPRDTETAFWPAALSVLSLAITPGKSGAFCLPHCSVKALLWAARPRLALPGGYRSTCVVWIA